MRELLGRVLKNRYHIPTTVMAFLGEGAMAEVYCAFDSVRDEPVALKVLLQGLAEDPNFVRRFELEAERVASMAHRNIVRCYGLERDEDLVFMVIEYIDGRHPAVDPVRPPRAYATAARGPCLSGCLPGAGPRTQSGGDSG